MKFSRALLISILITLALTLVLQYFFGAMAFGMFLFLPLSFAFTRKHSDRPDRSPDHPQGPIEPR